MNQPPPPGPILKCGGSTQVSAAAGSIAHALREHGRAELHAVGASAVNQAVKASAVAGLFLERDGLGLVMWPEFFQLDIDGESRTGIAFHYTATKATNNQQPATNN